MLPVEIGEDAIFILQASIGSLGRVAPTFLGEIMVPKITVRTLTKRQKRGFEECHKRIPQTPLRAATACATFASSVLQVGF